MRIFNYLLVFILVLCCGETGQSTRLADIGFYSKPESIVNEVDKRSKDYREHFILANAYKKQKKYKDALFHYANSCFTDKRNFSMRLFAQPVFQFVSKSHSRSPLYDDAIYHIADIFFKYNDYKYVIRFTGLLGNTRSRGLHRDSLFLTARAYEALLQYQQALNTLKKIQKLYTQENGGLVSIRTAAVLRKLKKYKEALKVYISILQLDCQSWQSVIAVKGISAIIKEQALPLNQKQQLLMANGLFYNRQYRNSLQTLSKLPQKNQEVLRLYIKNYIHLKQFSKANSIIKSQKSNPEIFENLLIAQANEMWKVKRRLAVNIYKDILNLKKSDYRQEAMKKIAVYMLNRKQKHYQKAVLSYISRYNNETSCYFLWMLARNNIKVKKFTLAISYLQQLLQIKPDSQYSDRARFWLYKIYKQKKNKKKAFAIFVDLVVKNPGSSYTWYLIKTENKHYSVKLLLEGYRKTVRNNSKECLFYHTMIFYKNRKMSERNARLKEMPGGYTNRYDYINDALQDMQVSSENRYIAKYIKHFFAIGYEEGISRELSMFADTKEGRLDKYNVLCFYGRKYNHYFYMVYSVLKLLKERDNDENVACMPESVIKSLYPLAFYKCIMTYASKYKIESFTLLSVMKAESLFKHTAVSSAGAVGLMQLMPSTARQLAKKNKIYNYSLTDPCVSIHMGADYIAWLKKYLNERSDDVFAAYNAGAGRIKGWRREMSFTDPAYFMEFIPYIETRYYILRINRFLEMYKLMYTR